MASESRLVSLDREMRATKGWQIEQAIQQLDDVQWIFGRNLAEARAAFIAFQDPQMRQIWAVERRPQLREYQLDTTRRLQNAFSSAVAALHHAGSISGRLRAFDPNVPRRFAESCKTFSREPLSMFIDFLRDHAVHVGPHLTMAQLKLLPGQQQPSSRVLLDAQWLQQLIGRTGSDRKLRTAAERRSARQLQQFLATRTESEPAALDPLSLLTEHEGRVNDLLMQLRTDQIELLNRYSDELEGLRRELSEELEKRRTG